MKIFLVLFFLLSASMTPLPRETVQRHECLPEEEVSCLAYSSVVCPPGYLDQCLFNEGDVHKCIPTKSGPSCEIEFDLRCPENFEDGCLTGETDIHFCVPVLGEFCSSSDKFSCPSGFVDSCEK